MSLVVTALVVAGALSFAPVGPHDAGPLAALAVARAQQRAPATPSAVVGSINLLTPSVSPGGRARIRVDLRAIKQLSSVTLALVVRDPRGRRAVPDQRVRAATLASGRVSYDFAVDLTTPGRAAAGRAEGLYPFEVTLSSAGAIVWRSGGHLFVVDTSKRAPLVVCLVWRLDEGIHTDPAGDFIDNAMQAAVARAPGSRGPVAYHAGQLLSHPSIRASIALSPATMAQVRHLTGGARRSTAGTTVTIRTSSLPARNARATLARWRRLLNSTRVEALSEPYADAPVEALIAQHHRGDVGWQLDVGTSLLAATVLATPTPAIYRPDATTDTVSALSKLGIRGVVVSAGSLAAAKRAPDRPFRFAADPLPVGFAADTTLSALLTASTTPDKGLDAFFAGLAKRYVRGDSMVVVAIPRELPDIEDAQLGRLYARLEASRWLRTKTLSEALQVLEPSGAPATLATTSATNAAQASFKAIARTRQDYLALRAMADPANSVVRQVLLQFLTGESLAARSTAQQWLGVADATCEQQFARIRVFASPSVTLASETGKIAVSVRNDNPYEARARLVLSGAGVSFPDGDVESLRVLPKDNVYAVKVALVGARIHGRVLAKLAVGPRVLGRAVVTVRSTYIGRLSLVALIIAALGGLLLYLWRRRGANIGERAPTTEEHSA